MKLIVGLGNPGTRYRGTRHNVGFEVINELTRRRDLEFEATPTEAVFARDRLAVGDVVFVKPLTFMNLSGRAVVDLQRYYRVCLEEILIISEDLNLPLGCLRARARGSDGGHNGLRSVLEQLGTEEVSRLRVGVGRGDSIRSQADHVLSQFEPGERSEIEIAIRKAADAVDVFIIDGIDSVMNAFNSREVGKEIDEHTETI